MERDIFKKIGLISKSGFLASSLLNIGAMENKINESENISEIKINNKFTTLEQILNPDKKEDLSSLNTYKTSNIIDNLYNKLRTDDISSYEIMYKNNFLELIEKHKEGILWAIKLGEEARKKAYDLAKDLRKYIKERGESKDLLNYYKILRSYFIDKNGIDPKTTDLGMRYNPIIKEFKNMNINNEILKIDKDFDLSKLILISTCLGFNDDMIRSIGRYVLNGITKDKYNEKLNGKDKGSSELKRLFNGEMNCTCNTFMLYTFLRLNKILCYNYMMCSHEFVLIPLKDENNKAINFYRVDLNEKGTIDYMSFSVINIIEISNNDDIWKGINIDNNNGFSSLSDYSIFDNGFTPTYMYYKNLRDFIDGINLKIEKEKEKYKSENIKNDIELITYYLNGLKNAWEYINKTYKDKDGNYIVKILPIEQGNCLFLPNVLDLGEPKLIELNNGNFNYKKIMFNSTKKPGEYLNLMYANINIPDEYKNYENIGDLKLKITETNFEHYYIKYSILYKKNEIIKEGEKSYIENKMRDNFVKVCDLNND